MIKKNFKFICTFFFSHQVRINIYTDKIFKILSFEKNEETESRARGPKQIFFWLCSASPNSIFLFFVTRLLPPLRYYCGGTPEDGGLFFFFLFLVSRSLSRKTNVSVLVPRDILEFPLIYPLGLNQPLHHQIHLHKLFVSKQKLGRLNSRYYL